MRASVLLRLALGSVLAVAACHEGPSKDQCQRLLDHLVDIEANAGGAGGRSADTDKQKTAIKEYARGQKFMESCQNRTPKKLVECGLAAKDADALAKCDRGK